MNIVGVCACTAGIAHTYMAREHVLQAAKDRGGHLFYRNAGNYRAGKCAN